MYIDIHKGQTGSAKTAIAIPAFHNGGTSGESVELCAHSCGVSVRPSTDRFICGLYVCGEEQMQVCTGRWTCTSINLLKT